MKSIHAFVFCIILLLLYYYFTVAFGFFAQKVVKGTAADVSNYVQAMYTMWWYNVALALPFILWSAVEILWVHQKSFHYKRAKGKEDHLDMFDFVYLTRFTLNPCNLSIGIVHFLALVPIAIHLLLFMIFGYMRYAGPFSTFAGGVLLMTLSQLAVFYAMSLQIKWFTLRNKVERKSNRKIRGLE